MTNSTVISEVDPISNPDRHVLPVPRIIAGGVAAAVLLTGLSTEVGAEPVSDSVSHTSVMPEGWAPDYGSVSLDFPGVERATDEVSNPAEERTSSRGFTLVKYVNPKGVPVTAENDPIRLSEIEMSCERRYLRNHNSWQSFLHVKISGLVKDVIPGEYNSGNTVHAQFQNIYNEYPNYATVQANSKGIARFSEWYVNQFNTPDESKAERYIASMVLYKQRPYGYHDSNKRLAKTFLSVNIACPKKQKQ